MFVTLSIYPIHLQKLKIPRLLHSAKTNFHRKQIEMQAGLYLPQPLSPYPILAPIKSLGLPWMSIPKLQTSRSIQSLNPKATTGNDNVTFDYSSTTTS